MVPTLENKCNDIITRWENKRLINDQCAYSLKTHNSVVAKAYALPKVHKPNLSWRLIVSTVGSPTYKLSKYISNILKPVSINNSFFVKNSWELKDTLKNIIIPKYYSIVSLDVVSMFDSIPINLALDCIEEKINQNHNLTKITKNELIIATRTVFNGIVFSFNKKFYKQVSGCPMGSPLSPVISDLVLQDVENRALKILDFKPILYKRYVDDILTIIPTNKIDVFVKVFNSIEDSIQFTHECEKNNVINYLDLQIIKTSDGSLHVNWYKKPSWSGRYLNFNSHNSFGHKIGLIKGLVDRCIKLSDIEFRKENLNLLKITLTQNNYPLELINDTVAERIHEIYNTSIQINKKNRWRDTQKKFQLNVTIPYIQGLSERLKNSFKKYNINVYFKSTNTLENYLFKKKDTDSIEDISNVIYQINCKCCNKIYIGETGRRLKSRIAEHKRDCRIGNQNTGLSQHSWNCDHHFDFDFKNIKILATEKNTFQRRIIESIFINKFHNITVNLQSETLNINKIYQSILK